MKSYIKKKPVIVCCVLFTICLCVRFFEYFVIRTDETAIGENLIHKAVGIILLLFVLKAADIRWSEIGFIKRGFAKSILQGLILSIA